MTTGISKQDIRAAAIGAGAGLAIFGALSFFQNPHTSKFETTAFPATSVQDVSGTRMPDGSILAGTSPDTGRTMYATPKDAPLTYTFDKAQAYCAALDAHGHKDWRVPTKDELSVLFESRAAIGNFNTSGSYPAGWYWSSSRSSNGEWAQRFSDGIQDYGGRGHASALRCVRG